MDRDLLVQALIVVVIANTLVIGLALAGGSRRRRVPAGRTSVPAPIAPQPTLAMAPAAVALGPASEAPEIVVVGPSPERPEIVAAGLAVEEPEIVAVGPAPQEPATVPAAAGAAGPPVVGGPTWDEITALVGLQGPAGWHDAVLREGHRVLRSGGRLAVVALEARGYPAVEERFGSAAGGALAGSLARIVRELSREADVVACIGPAAFRMLLLDTDRSGAARCVERLAAAADPWLTAGGLAVRLAAGTAAVPVEADLPGAIRLAEERMHRDGRRPELAA